MFSSSLWPVRLNFQLNLLNALWMSLCHHWGNYLLTLECSLDQYSREVRPLWWKRNPLSHSSWATLISKSMVLCSPNLPESWCGICFLYFCFWPLSPLVSDGAGQRSRALSQIWCLPLTFWQCFLTPNSPFSHFSQPHSSLVFCSQESPLPHSSCLTLKLLLHLFIYSSQQGNLEMEKSGLVLRIKSNDTSSV